MNSKQRQTLEAVFAQPVRANVNWKDVESLLEACGADYSRPNLLKQTLIPPSD